MADAARPGLRVSHRPDVYSYFTLFLKRYLPFKQQAYHSPHRRLPAQQFGEGIHDAAVTFVYLSFCGLDAPFNVVDIVLHGFGQGKISAFRPYQAGQFIYGFNAI